MRSFVPNIQVTSDSIEKLMDEDQVGGQNREDGGNLAAHDIAGDDQLLILKEKGAVKPEDADTCAMGSMGQARAQD